MEGQSTSDLYADLHEAQRRGRIFHYVTDEQKGLRRQPLDLGRPVYDFDDAIKYLLRDKAAWARCLTRATDLMRAGTLVAEPMALRLTLITTDGPDDPTRFTTDTIICIDLALLHTPSNESGPGIVIHCFESDRGCTFGPRRDRWTCGPRITMGSEHWTFETRDGRWDGRSDHSDFQHYNSMQQYIVCMLGCLATEPEFVDRAPSPSFQAVQRGRARGGLSPLPAVRELRINRTIYSQRPSTEPTGREMPVHRRRGTFRTYQHPRFTNMRGKVGPVSGSVVRADKGEPPPAIYHVTLATTTPSV